MNAFDGVFVLIFFGMRRAKKTEKTTFKNITMNEWERATGDEVISVLVLLNDLKTLFGVSQHIGVGLFLVRLAAWCEDCKAVWRLEN